jgi:hypothetical protein
MSSFSDYTENKVVDHVLGTATFTKPTAVYVALFTAAPSDSGGGTEVSGGSYARVAATFSAASGGATSNSATIDFGTASASWGTITHMAIFDASTAGNMLAWAPLAASKTVASGDAFQVPAGSLTVSLS